MYLQEILEVAIGLVFMWLVMSISRHDVPGMAQQYSQ